MKSNITTRGVTLIELVIYIAFAAMIGVVVTNVILAHARQERISQEYQLERESITKLFESIESDVRAATSIQSPTAGAQTNTLELTVSGDSTTYSLEQAGITRLRNSTQQVLVPTSSLTVNSFLVANYSAPGSKPSITVSINIDGTDYEYVIAHTYE